MSAHDRALLLRGRASTQRRSCGRNPLDMRAHNRISKYLQCRWLHTWAPVAERWRSKGLVVNHCTAVCTGSWMLYQKTNGVELE